jgi:16S rRNA (guanine1207-N2)-methyltransferase
LRSAIVPDVDLDRLRRWPDVEAPNLFAVDASDRLILDEASLAVAAAPPGTVVVINDHYGALAIGAAANLGATGVRVFQDALVGEAALSANARGITTELQSLPLGRELLFGATVVLLQVPRSLAELDEIAGDIARWADPSVVVFAGGRIKHLALTMNSVLTKHFGRLDVSLARQKSRVLIAREPIAAASDFPVREYPVREYHDELGLWVCAHGAVFAGAKLDLGTRLLLSVLDGALADAATAIDLGSGTGILAASLARSRPAITVIATDQSAAAVASSLATMAANHLADRVKVVRDDGLRSQPDASVDLIVLNPPFHVGATVHTGLADRLFRDAARVLRPGGELWTVYNSHLAYRPSLQSVIGSTREVVRNTRFTVTSSRRRVNAIPADISASLSDSRMER